MPKSIVKLKVRTKNKNKKSKQQTLLTENKHFEAKDFKGTGMRAVPERD